MKNLRSAILINIIVVFCLQFISFIVKSQNLQFSQVKLINTLETVPAGKVWKIEGFMYNQSIPLTPVVQGNGYAPQVYNQDEKIIINNLVHDVRSTRFIGIGWMGGSYSTGPALYNWEQKLPIWLPAGSTLDISTGVAYINVIEFTIIP
jgi:hypothetical protein